MLIRQTGTIAVSTEIVACRRCDVWKAHRDRCRTSERNSYSRHMRRQSAAEYGSRIEYESFLLNFSGYEILTRKPAAFSIGDINSA